MMKYRALYAGIGLLAAGLLFTGCASEATQTSSPKTETTQTDSSKTETEKTDSSKTDEVKFTGPLADEFAETYGEVTSEFERSVMRDSEITKQEIEEVIKRFSECLSGHGFTELSFEKDGSVYVGFPPGQSTEASREQAQACELDSVTKVWALYSKTL